MLKYLRRIASHDSLIIDISLDNSEVNEHFTSPFFLLVNFGCLNDIEQYLKNYSSDYKDKDTVKREDNKALIKRDQTKN
jgi:hypothetical protein